MQDEPDSSEIASMKEEILQKFDENFDGKINLEEVCSLDGNLNMKIVPQSQLSREFFLTSRRNIKHFRDINGINYNYPSWSVRVYSNCYIFV